MRAERRLAGRLLSLAVLSAAPAVAQTDQDNATRAMLLEQARAAQTSGDHPRALDAAQRAGQIRMTPSVRMFIAQEHAATGHFAEALGAAQNCVREVARDTAARERESILAVCNELIAGMQPRVAHVVVRVPEPTPPGTRVHVGSNELNSALYGVPYVVNPGANTVLAEAPGYESFRSEVTVASGARAEVRVELRAATPVAPSSAPAPSAASALPVAPSAAPAPAVPPPAPSTAPAPSIVGPAVLGGVGLVSFGAAAIFYGLRAGALEGCTLGATIECNDAMTASRAQDAYTWNTLTNVGLVVGGVAVAGGVTWFIVSRATASRREARPVALAPSLGPVTGASVWGSF